MTDPDLDVDPSPPEGEDLPPPPTSRGTDQALWVGFFLILGIISGLAALFILTDAAIFRGRNIVTTHVPDAGGIRRGDPVQMLGVNIGRVQRFKIDPDGVVIRLELEGEYDVPKDSTILLKSSGLLGGMVADVVPGRSTEMIKDGDNLPGRTEEGLFDVAERIAVDVEVVMKRVEKLLSERTVASISATTQNLEAGSGQMKKLLVDVQGAVVEQRRELGELTQSLQRSAAGAEKVVNAPEVDRAIKRLDSLTQQMDTVLASFDRSAKSVETVTGRVERGEGSLGKLSRDEEIYRNLNQAMLNVNQTTVNINKLSEEIRRDPRKYLKLSVF